MAELRDVRLRRELTQEQLAERSGVEQATISAIETGRNRKPSWDTVARLARALDVDPHVLFPITDERKEIA